MHLNPWKKEWVSLEKGTGVLEKQDPNAEQFSQVHMAM